MFAEAAAGTEKYNLFVVTVFLFLRGRKVLLNILIQYWDMPLPSFFKQLHSFLKK